MGSNPGFACMHSLPSDSIKWDSSLGEWGKETLQRRSGPKAAPTNLGDDGDLEAKVMEPDFRNVNPVNEDLSFRRLFDPKQAKHQRGLPGPGPSDDAHLRRAESRDRTACSRNSCKGPGPSQEELGDQRMCGQHRTDIQETIRDDSP